MAVYSRHFLICTNRRASDAPMPSCAANAAAEIAAAFRGARAEHGLGDSVFITETGCLGACPRDGVTVVVYPEAVWYVGITRGDVAEIVSSHMLGGKVVERLRSPAWGIAKSQ